VRIPSAWNDLVCLNTAHGLLSLAGVVPLCLTFDTVGPLCRSVADAALLSAILAGEKPADLTGAGSAGARVAVLQTIALDDLQDTPRTAFEDTLERLQGAGVQLTQLDFPALQTAFSLAGTLYGADSYGWWRDRVEAAPEKMFPQILERVRGGRSVGGADYVAGWLKLRDIRAEYVKATAGFDAVILPTAPIMPPKTSRLLSDDTYYKEQNLLALRNTRVANLLDLVSVTLPTDVPSCGVMLNGPRTEEVRLLRLAAALAPVAAGQ